MVHLVQHQASDELGCVLHPGQEGLQAASVDRAVSVVRHHAGGLVGKVVVDEASRSLHALAVKAVHLHLRELQLWDRHR